MCLISHNFLDAFDLLRLCPVLAKRLLNLGQALQLPDPPDQLLDQGARERPGSGTVEVKGSDVLVNVQVWLSFTCASSTTTP
jgi:hypothetical protein